MSFVEQIVSTLNSLGPGVMCFIIGLGLYPLSRYVLPNIKSKLTVTWIMVILGMASAIILFKQQMLIALAMSVIFYFPLDKNPMVCIICAFIYSSAVNLYYQIATTAWSFTVNGLTMVIFQRIMMTTFNLYHGRQAKAGQEIKRPFHKKLALSERPSFLEWIAFTFTPYGQASGPVFEYKLFEYILESGSHPRVSDDSKSHKRAVRRLFGSLFWGVFTLLFLKYSDISFYSSEFYIKQPALIRLFLTILCSLIHTTRYFAAWQAYEAGIYECGLGECDLCEFDDITNYSIVQVLESPTVGIWLQRWNHSAHLFWKKYLFYPLLDNKWGYFIAHHSVFVVSALWHGFYPVYYLLLPEMIASTVADQYLNQCFPQTPTQPFIIKCLYRIWVVLSMMNTTSTWWYRTFDAFFFVRKSNGYSGTIIIFAMLAITYLCMIIIKPQRPKSDKKEEVTKETAKEAKEDHPKSQ